MKKWVPWWGKMLGKILLSRMPITYHLWKRIGLFRHGGMANANYAISVFKRHFSRVEFKRKKSDFVALELGPGDSVASVIIAKAFGAYKCYMVDAGVFVSDDMAAYHGVVTSLREQNILVDDVCEKTDLRGLLDQYGGVYLTNRLDSLRSIPDASVDFIWSQAVLEHIPLHEFDQTMYELRRILGKNGVCSHRIDLKDHLDSALNNLRFSEAVWEAEWMTKSGFYTNRIRFADMMDRFDRAGFEPALLKKDCWDQMPIARNKLNKPYMNMPEDELLVCGFDIVLKPKSHSPL